MPCLVKKGSLSFGIIQRNRIPDGRLPADKKLSKKECSGIHGQCRKYMVRWKNNKIVTLTSSFVDEQPKPSLEK